MQKIYASIITIGDELLIGQTIDTNSAWMAQELNKISVWVKRRVAVGDVWNDIWQALDEESKHSSIILITGGLGPTADDITKPLLCKYFNGTLVVNEDALNNVKTIFQKLNRPIIERNLKQAEVPDTCTVIQNKRGTAPGMWFEQDGKIFVSMPGVPFEMKGMMTDDVLPQLPKYFSLPNVLHRTLLTAGQGESFIAEHIKNFETALPDFIKLAYLPNYGMVKLRLTATGTDKMVLEKLLDEKFLELQNLVSDFLVTNEDEPMEKVVGKLLASKNKTLATAESCTGGNIAHLITSIAGSSIFYKGSIISYANEVKQAVLNIDEDVLKTFGAVSEQTVIQMAKGVLNKINADYAIATSGIMGPDGGSAEKPVGTVWIAVGNKNKIEATRLHFRFDRERNISLTTAAALNLLRKFILNEE